MRWTFVRLTLVVLAIVARAASGAEITINAGQPLVAVSLPFTIAGTTDAPDGFPVGVIVGDRYLATSVVARRWEVTVDWPIAEGGHRVQVAIGGNMASADLRVDLRGGLPRQSLGPPRPVDYAAAQTESLQAAEAMTDRWRIVPPPYELDENSRGPLDPYNRNVLKGDYPIRGNDVFLVLTGITDTLAESRTLPTPSGVSAARPRSFHFFGHEEQSFFNENVTISADLFQGDTAFKPVVQRVKATIVGNVSKVRVAENGVVKPDVRRGTHRNDGHVSLQELFYEMKLRDLSPNYDFVSFRAGSQPFTSDFRGFIFSDTNLAVRLFGNWAANRFQYNLALFDRLEKDTNSGLNRIAELRQQRVAVANVYWQDFIVPGYTQQFSVHLMRDKPSVAYDRNGFLVRPAPIGVFQPHEIQATYLGESGLGHIGRFNVDHAAYYVFGHDTLNPIAGPDPRLRGGDGVRIGAGMVALEVSYDRDWLRPRLALFYASGDSKPRDRRAGGFDAIYDAPAFAGAGFSFFNRLGIRLPGTGVSLVERGSLLPDLKTSKDEGQPNYVNPGIQLLSAGVDIDVTPRLKTIVTVNAIRLDTTATLETVLFQDDIDQNLGVDASVGARFRPFLSNNVIVVGGLAAFIPGQGFEDIYERTRALYHLFTNVILTF